MYHLLSISPYPEYPLIEQLNRLKINGQVKLHLSIREKLNPADLKVLCDYIKTHSPLPFKKLSLDVDSNTLKDPEFINLIKSLNATAFAGLSLVFEQKEINTAAKDIEASLLKIAPLTNFPIHAQQHTEDGVVAVSLELKQFQDLVINGIREKYKNAGVALNSAQGKAIIRDPNHPMAQPIALKKIVMSKDLENQANKNKYIQLEIQHVEQVEQVVQQEVVVEQQVNIQINEVQAYHGRLLGHYEFSASVYKKRVVANTANANLTDELYALLSQELFANIPNAIKYISPEAAEQLTLNLPGLVTLNKDNLPQGFLLKRTYLGELVLDYDPFVVLAKNNPFVPEEGEQPDDLEPIYPIEVQGEGFKPDAKQHLSNMFIKYGTETVNAFFKRLNALEVNDRLKFIYTNYMKHLPQWDHLTFNEPFFNAIERIRQYDKEKLACLEKFLSNTGSSRHDLAKTVTAFEALWHDLIHLCSEKKVSISKINANWTTPKGGNPVVYMERLQFILKNARDLDDQLTNLEGLRLDNYGAYYAAKEEGFRSVAAAMEFDYNPEKQSRVPYNPALHLYRVELDSLIDSLGGSVYSPGEIINAGVYKDGVLCSAEPEKFWLIRTDKATSFSKFEVIEQLQKDGYAIPFSDDKFVAPWVLFKRGIADYLDRVLDSKPDLKAASFNALGYRFVGQQNSGILASILIKAHQQYAPQFYGDKDSTYIVGEKYRFLIAALLLISHERSKNDKPLHELFKSLEYTRPSHKYLKEFSKLFQLDIKLNEEEGLLLLEMVTDGNGGILWTGEDKEKNISELPDVWHNPQNHIDKLLISLQHNKFATLKYLRAHLELRREHRMNKWPVRFALDTAEFLAKDASINALYHDDLLLFGGLINNKVSTSYYVDRKDKNTDAIVKNLKKVQYFLNKAATLDKPNNMHYAVQRLLDAKQYFTYDQFIKSLGEIEKLSAFSPQEVQRILISHQLNLTSKLPGFFTKDSGDLKALMVDLIIKITTSTPKKNAVGVDVDYTEQEKSTLHQELSLKSIVELQTIFKEKWGQAGTLFALVNKPYMTLILKSIKESTINAEFGMPQAKGLLKQIAETIGQLSSFQDYSDFEKANAVNNEIASLANLFKTIMQNPYVIEQEKNIIALFQDFDFSKIEYTSLYSVLNLLAVMPQRNYLPLLSTLLKAPGFMANTAQVIDLTEHLTALNARYLPNHYLVAFSNLRMSHPKEKGFMDLRTQIYQTFARDNNDPVLELAMTEFTGQYKQYSQILSLSMGITTQRDKLAHLFAGLKKINKLDSVLNQLTSCRPDAQIMVLEIISKGFAAQRSQENQSVDYNKLIAQIEALPPEQLTSLHSFYQSTPVSINCLDTALQQRKPDMDFKKFLSEFEKAPYGKRNLATQFDCSQVERVVNQSMDLLNNSPYPYQYRKQLMEAFLFVNQIGNDLPVYDKKAAKELTNEELASYFADLKNKSIPNITDFQRRILALGLMREAMYRATGEFPYSSQVIALIDGIMHEGDLIANIDTGQGKSLIDSMKAVLLYLDSDRVDLSTSSLVDAKRDIANYGPFFKLLGLPYSERPISASSPVTDFKKEGINFSTFSQFSLFFAKAKVTGDELETPDTKVSLVLNESDYTLLDSRIINRFASADGSGLGIGQEWVYYAINEFVNRPEFVNNSVSAGEDIDALKDYLRVRATAEKKSPKIVDKFDDEQYLSWIESALMVNFKLKENVEYVIPDEHEKKLINGVEFRSKVVKILMSDGKVSPDSSFGNGMQQLLYARLNKERNSTDFIIEPQNKTIISANNKNLLAYYRSKEGFIWGSSGTVGSNLEIEEQYAKYGFAFSKKEPHQKNQVRHSAPQILEDEDKQFAELLKQLTASELSENSAPNIVFCKDIPTATRLFELLNQNNNKKIPLQLYTGLGKEEDYIRKASKPGMITVTTSALGRNTDIHYDKKVGLNVWNTCIDSTRSLGQKSGRTGRQGSQGSVHYILNKQEVSDKTIEQITLQMDVQAAQQRTASEELYDVMGALLAFVDALPGEEFVKGKATFFTEVWSKFSADLETQFRELKRKPSYDLKQFTNQTLNAFNQLMQTHVNPAPEALLTIEMSSQKGKKTQYIPHTAKVRMKDCTPPIAIAYQMLQYEAVNGQTLITTDVVTEKLKELFTKLGNNRGESVATEYLQYLNANPVTQATINIAHKHFLSSYLLPHVANKSGFISRWLGFSSTLSQIASDQNYLLMFQALAAVPNQTKPDVDILKLSIVALLDDYLETSWFISTDRRESSKQLQDDIMKAKDIKSLIRCLSQSQINTAQHDLEKSKDRLKPLNYFGHSRYQETLTKALNLTTALSGNQQDDDSVEQLKELLVGAGDKPDLTLDAVKNNKEKLSGTKKVIATALENTLEKTNRKEPVGMLGRNRFFDDQVAKKGDDLDGAEQAPDLQK